MPLIQVNAALGDRRLHSCHGTERDQADRDRAGLLPRLENMPGSAFGARFVGAWPAISRARRRSAQSPRDTRPNPLTRDLFGLNPCASLTFCLRMIFSDLASPAEAGFALGSGLWPARAQAPAGTRFPCPIRSMTSFSGSCAERAGASAPQPPDDLQSSCELRQCGADKSFVIPAP